jgi:hypothetical protein
MPDEKKSHKKKPPSQAAVDTVEPVPAGATLEVPEGFGGTAGGMEGTSEVTNAHIMNRMWEEETKKFHTEINEPHGMSTFEDVVEIVREEFGNEVVAIVDDWINYFKTNMVANKRKRALEMVEMMKAEAAKEKSRLEARVAESLNR